MAKHIARIEWSRGEAAFADGRYSRGHTISFDGGVSIAASSSPSVIPAPLSVVEAADPEELLIASLSSCHMLTFLDLARRAGFIIDRYEDNAEGTLGKNEAGRFCITSVTLKPQITYSGAAPSPEQLHDLHHKAHELCFIANSVNCPVIVE
ncbi:MAG: OsmC family protein [Caulobacterales bacterium]